MRLKISFASILIFLQPLLDEVRSFQRLIRVNVGKNPTNFKFMKLFGGRGIAKDYKWSEGQFEIEVTVSVPLKTRGKDIQFQTTPTSVDLQLGEKVLLDGCRAMRGRINVDGTFWSFCDEETDGETREVVVTVEKHRSPQQNADGEFSVVDDDWGGFYLDDEDEVSYRKYKEPEELDVREYAKALGIDLDNLNMTMVDKDMYSIRNMTKTTMEKLKENKFISTDDLSEFNDYVFPQGSVMIDKDEFDKEIEKD